MDITLILQALIMGLVEGVTEFLPISSTGYLIITARLLDFWTIEKADLFTVVIQLGAISAVIYEYFGKLWRTFLGLITQKGPHAQLSRTLIIATLPVILVGFTLATPIKAYLFNVYTVASMLIIGGLLIFWVESRGTVVTAVEVEDVTLKQAIWIGLIQCLALIPGTSRSGATIIGALYLGVSRKAAAEFSFFLGVPVLIGAGVLDTVKSYDILSGPDWGIMLVGVVASFVFALIVIRWLVAWVSKHDFRLFGWLRIITGVLILITGLTGWITWG